MKWSHVLPVFIACKVADFYLGTILGAPWYGLLILGTTIWAAVDSYHLQLERYESGVSYGPVGLFVGLLLLWLPGFPWYLVVRHQIRTGRAVFRADDPLPAV